MASGEMTIERARETRARWADVEGFEDFLHDHALDLSTWYAMDPERHHCAIPDEGAWIMVKRQPHTVIESPPLYSMWRARPVYYALKLKRAPGPGRPTITWPLLRARISTPFGELTLLPDEFVPVTRLMEWVGSVGEGVSLHTMGPGAIGDEDFEQRVFYLMSRGLARRDALLLLLPDVLDQEFAWLSLDGSGAEEYIERARSAA